MNTLVGNRNTAIDSNSSISANITFETQERLSTFEIYLDDIVKITSSLDPNKAHRHDRISVCMIKTCASSILKPLLVPFRDCFENECFPKEQPKANTVPFHKKNGKQLIKNY